MTSLNEDVVVLLGGGLDGYAVLLHLKQMGIDDIHVVCVDYGQLAAQYEIEAVEKQVRFTGVQKFSVVQDRSRLIETLNPNGLLFGHPDGSPMLYGRNLVLLLHAMQYGSTIYLGLDKPYHGGPPFFDCTLDYFQQAIKLIGNPDVSVSAPFVDTDKLDVCYEAVQLDSHFFDRTFTCWTPVNGQECGTCKHCKTKQDLRVKVQNLFASEIQSL